MRPDLALEMRSALLKAMKSSADIIALIPKAAIFAATVPANQAWPFSRIGSIIGSPFVADGLDGTSFRVLVQGFTKDVLNAGTIVSPAEDNAYRIGAAIKRALDGAVIALPGGGTAKFEWQQTIPLVTDTEASAWYVTATFEVEVTPP